LSCRDVLFEVQRTETFIEKKINEFFTKVQRTVTNEVRMWKYPPLSLSKDANVKM
jgi:hypothetical protein